MANNVEKKITKIMKLTAIIAHFKDMDANEVLDVVTVKTGKDTTQQVSITAGMAIAYAENEINLLSKKHSAPSTKATEAQVKMEQEILDFLTENPTQVFAAAELCKEVPAFALYEKPVSTQRVTPRLNALLERGLVKVSKEKGKNLWQYAGDTEEVEEDYED